MAELQAIETQYKGQWYRSQLEARWAAVLDTLKIVATYEPSTYHTTAGYYVPDFWLEGVGHFLEIKPSHPKPEEVAKATALYQQAGRPVFFLCDFPVIEKASLCNADVCWHDGWQLGLGMPITVKLLYVLKLPETEEAIQRLILAMHHAKAVIQQRPTLLSVKDIMRRLHIPWPPIDTSDHSNQETPHA